MFLHEIEIPDDYQINEVDDVNLYSTWVLFYLALGKSNK